MVATTELAIVEIVRQLPPEWQDEVLEYAQYIFEKKVERKGRKLRLSWVGGLEEFRDQYTSLELQKKALEWRGD